LPDDSHQEVMDKGLNADTHPDRIAVAWAGLPEYGARMLHSVLTKFGERLTVLATPSPGATQEADRITGAPVLWLDSQERGASWQHLGVAVPQVFIQTGWATPAFNALGAQVRRTGGRVVAMIDNSYKRTLRQWMGALAYRAYFKHWFAQVWVPGASGKSLCRFFGVPADRIYTGLYVAAGSVFYPVEALALRPNHFLFVGQFIKRKGIDTICRAYTSANKAGIRLPPMEMYGSGPLLNDIVTTRGCAAHNLATSETIAQAMRRSRFLVLPSREEHWGVVVHEAALSGCGLILTDRVGSRLDLADHDNSYIIKRDSPEALLAVLQRACGESSARLRRIMQVSLQMANKFTSDLWERTFCAIVNQLPPP
jgi:glycosyltransferase involved in cell wall biosynthesis